MKASELRIGNFYESTDGSGFIKATAKDLYAWESGAIYGKPIPLTEEWLLKAVFRQLDKYTFVKNGLFIHKRKNGFIFNIGKKKIKVEFVHSIQNIYFALTGEELIFDL